jgi:hypothetical protein
MATYDQWLDAFSDAYDLVPAPPIAECPHCGHPSLRLVFTGDLDRMVGYAHFWCDNCLHGIGISRTTIPDGAQSKTSTSQDNNATPKSPTTS